MDLSKLREPFPAKDIEWRIQSSGIKNGGNPWGKCLAYITSRAIQDRLDEVCGPENWQNEFKPAPLGGILCGLSIYTGNGWVTKWNGADNTDIEAVKGGLSSATKRAGVEWGIGRYLYKLSEGWAIFGDGGAYSAKIKDNNGKTSWYNWNPPGLPDWALPKKSIEDEYDEEKEVVIAANYDRDDVEYDYHDEKEIIAQAKSMEELKSHFAKYFKNYKGNIEAQTIITDAYTAKKNELLPLELF